MGRTNRNNRRSRNRRIDRLSSLPDDILIGIISLLPLQLAIATGTLSHRWRGLWTNVTSINITIRYDYKLCKFDTILNDTMTQITSPFIHSFSFDFLKYCDLILWAPCLDIMIRDVCSRNVHQLKVTRCKPYLWDINYTLPSVIFQTQSLVSIELGSIDASYLYDYCWLFPEDFDAINLPNLKNLTVHFGPKYQWIEKLVKACPSLEKLSLNCWANNIKGPFKSCTFVISAPNLEYLAIFGPKCLTFSFEEEPIVLRETKIEFTDFHQAQSDKDKLSQFYETISNVRILTFDISTIDIFTTVFRNVTRLTFNMKLSHNLDTVLSVLEMCPAVDILSLKICSVDNDKRHPFDRDNNDKRQPLYGKPGNVSTSQQALRRMKSINVEMDNRPSHCKRAKSFLRFIMDLLGSTCDLEHFNLSVIDFEKYWSAKLLLNEKQEMELCKKIYWCPTISNCDVEFKGRFLKMSRKAGPKVTTTRGTVIYFGLS